MEERSRAWGWTRPADCVIYTINEYLTKKMSFKANSILVGVYLSFILYHLFVVCGYFNYYGLKKNEKGGTKTQN